MQENLIVLIAFLAHDGGTNLTETDTMSPPCSTDVELAGNTVFHIELVDDEGGAVQMALAQRTADFEFLADGERALRTDNLQFPYSAAASTLKRNEVENIAEVHAELFLYNRRELSLRVIDSPTIEVVRLLVVIIQHLRQNLLIMRVAERHRIGKNPLASSLFNCQVGLFGMFSVDC